MSRVSEELANALEQLAVLENYIASLQAVEGEPTKPRTLPDNAKQLIAEQERLTSVYRSEAQKLQREYFALYDKNKAALFAEFMKLIPTGTEVLVEEEGVHFWAVVCSDSCTKDGKIRTDKGQVWLRTILYPYDFRNQSVV